jgi:hypothetical protein
MNIGHATTGNVYTSEVQACNRKHDASRDLPSSVFTAASECTTFVRSMIIKSDSYDDMRLDMSALDEYESIDLQRKHHKQLLQTIKQNSFDRSIEECPENPMPLSFAYSSIDSIKYNTGNCGDMSLILGAILAKYIPQRLSGMGFSKDEIIEARINTSLMFNSAPRGNHVVVLMSHFNSNGLTEYILDPWLNASVFKKEEAYDFYKKNSSKFIDGTCCFEIYDKYTSIMNSSEYVEAITKNIEYLYEIDFSEMQITNPFKNYLIAL